MLYVPQIGQNVPSLKDSQVSHNKHGYTSTHTRMQICYSLNTQSMQHRAGNTSCRLHSLEMRNMIHFLSELDSHAL